MNKQSTITTSAGHGLGLGSRISLDIPDKSRWRRFWFFVTFRKPPVKRQVYIIAKVTDSSSVQVEPR